MTPRPNRNGWPDGRLINSVAALSNPRGRINFPKDWLFKSHSENKGTNDPRAEKPVLIATVKTDYVTLTTIENQQIARAKYYDPYIDGRSRYYFNEWGYELAKKADALSGSPVCNLVVNGKVLGTVNPSFRSGSFR
jgi:hypothetical protein